MKRKGKGKLNVKGNPQSKPKVRPWKLSERKEIYNIEKDIVLVDKDREDAREHRLLNEDVDRQSILDKKETGDNEGFIQKSKNDNLQEYDETTLVEDVNKSKVESAIQIVIEEAEAPSQKDVQIEAENEQELRVNPSILAGNDSNSNSENFHIVHDAKILVLCVDNKWRVAKSEWVLWVINHMFRPFDPFTSKDHFLKVVDISCDTEPTWILPEQEHGSQTGPMIQGNSSSKHYSASVARNIASQNSNSASTLATQEPSTTEPMQIMPEAKVNYRILPNTKIYTFYQRYSLVFLLDISSSLATVDPFNSTIIMNETLETFRRCLVGCLEPFSLVGNQIIMNQHFQPEIHLSVLADFTHIGTTSNLDTGNSTGIGVGLGKDANKDAIKTLLQDVVVTKDNLNIILKHVKRWYCRLQARMTGQDVRSGASNSIGVSYNMNTKLSSASESVPNPGINTDINPETNIEGDGSPGSLEGVELGENRGNTFLDYGLLTLRLSPEGTAQVLVLISDGVSEFKPRELGHGLRNMAKEGVQLVVIQVGHGLGFTPGCSLGYVPDNESFRFLAMATGGKFIYASDCPSLISERTGLRPNYYHQLMLIQETTFHRHRGTHRYTQLSFGNERVGDLCRERLLNNHLPCHGPQESTFLPDAAFPWDFNSAPPIMECLLTRYRDYALPLEVSCILNARLREGFFIEKIGLANVKHPKSDKLQINLAMIWLPNVVIQYRIRANLPSYFRAGPAHTQMPSKKYLRIEMNLLASSSFAVSFINYDTSKGRHPLKGVLSSQLKQLHQFLKGIFLTDDTLKTLNSLSLRFPMLKALKEWSFTPASNFRAYLLNKELVHRIDSDSIQSVWSNFANDKLEYISNGLFDDHSSLLSLQLNTLDMCDSSCSSTLRLKINLLDLKPLFEEQFNFHFINESTYILYLLAHKTGQHSFPSFCLLRLAPMTDTLIWSRLVFINVKYKIRELLIHDYLKVDYMIKFGQTSYHLRNCHRPLQNILVDYNLSKDEKFLNRHTQLPTLSKNYLKSFTKTWLNGVQQESYFIDHGLPGIGELVFRFLLAAKLVHGFIKAFHYEDGSVLFYKELSCLIFNVKRRFSLQYKLSQCPITNQVTSQVWSEPINGELLEDISEQEVSKMLAQDAALVSNLIAFDTIHRACRSQNKQLRLGLKLRSLVWTSVALVSEYRLPRLELAGVENHMRLQADIDLLAGRLKCQAHCSSEDLEKANSNPVTLAIPLSSEELFGLSPLTILCVLFQNAVERQLVHVMDTWVVAHHDDPCDLPIHRVSNPYFIQPEAASRAWGFAKQVSPTSFALVLVPNAVDMLRRYKKAFEQQPNTALDDSTNLSSTTESDCKLNLGMKLKLWTFECIRVDLKQPFMLGLTEMEAGIESLLDTKADIQIGQLYKGKMYHNLYPIIPSNERLAGILSSLQRMELWTECSKPQPNIAPSVHHLQNQYDAILAKAFTQSIYTSMLLGYPLDQNDVNTALALCYKVTLRIELTELLNLKKEKERLNLDLEAKPKMEALFQRNFERLIRSQFEKLTLPQSEDVNDPMMTYYFKPNAFVRKIFNEPISNQVVSEPDSTPTNTESEAEADVQTQSQVEEIELDTTMNKVSMKLEDLLSKVEHPLFMQFHFSFLKPQVLDSIFEIQVSQVPTTYPTIDKNGTIVDLAPSGIGDGKEAPLVSCDGTKAFLQLNLFLPPNSSSNETIEAKFGRGINEISFNEAVQHDDGLEGVLPAAQRHAIIELKLRIEWLIREEIVHGLISYRPTTHSVLKYISSHLSLKNPFTDFPTSFNIHLPFVDATKGQPLFFKELESMFLTPFHVVRMGSYFFIQALPEMKWKRKEVGLPFVLPEEPSEELDIFGGLGISMAERLENQEVIPNFWLVLIPDKDRVNILFFSRYLTGKERSRIVQRIRRKIAILLRRVNQMVLLRDLDETRICSKWLVPPDIIDDCYSECDSEELNDENNNNNDNSELGEEEEKEEEDNDNEQNHINSNYEEIENEINESTNNKAKPFKIGQFQCPLLFKESFQLHWRLKPNQALNHILSTVMHPLSVSNRHNLYVMNDATSVYYLRLYEKESILEDNQSENSKFSYTFNLVQEPIKENEELRPSSIITESSMNSISNSPSLKRPNSSTLLSSNLRTPTYHSGSNQLNLSNHSGSNHNHNALPVETRELILEVYGITIPGREVTEELSNLIYNRLNNHLTLGVVSSFLARNATLKLSQADINFIFPLKKHPTPQAHLTLKLPKWVMNPILALVYIKQNLLSFMHSLIGAEAKNQYKRFCNNYYLHSFGSSNNVCECFVGEFVLFYNSVASRNPTPIEASIGQGIALACFSIIDSEGKLVFTPTEKNLQHLGFRPLLTGEDFDIAVILDDMDGDIEEGSTPRTNTKFNLVIDVWAMGNVDLEAMIKQLRSSVKQSLTDYAMDCCAKSFLLELPLAPMSERRMSRVHSESDKALADPSLALDESFALVASIHWDQRLHLPASNILNYGHLMGNSAMFRCELSAPLTESGKRILLNQIVDWLTDQHSALIPTLLELKDGFGEIVHPCPPDFDASNKLNDLVAKRYILLSGLPELPSKLHPRHPASLSGHPNYHSSSHALPGFLPTSRRSSSEDMTSIKSGPNKSLLKKEKNLEELLFYAPYTHTHQCNKLHPLKLELIRSYYISIAMEHDQLRVHTYNLTRNFVNQLKAYVERILVWHRSRNNLLDLILQQKMGLFHLKYEVAHLQPSSTPPNASIEVSPLDFHKLAGLIKHITINPNRNRSTWLQLDIKSKSAADGSSIRSTGDAEVKVMDLHSQCPSIQRVLVAAPTEMAPFKNQNHWKAWDPLQIHGQEFMEAYYRALHPSFKREVSTCHSKLWEDALGSFFDGDIKILVGAELDSLETKLNSCHIFHTIRQPLFRFNTPLSSSMHKNAFFDAATLTSSAFIDWYNEVIAQWMSSYTKNLMALEWRCIGSDLPYNGTPTSSTVNPSINSPTYFFVRCYEDQPLFCKMKVIDRIIHLDLFIQPSQPKAIHPRRHLPDKLNNEMVDKSVNSMLNLASFRNELNLSSALYDFHVEQLFNWITNRIQSPPPNCNVLQLIDTFLNSEMKPGAYSINHLQYHELNFEPGFSLNLESQLELEHDVKSLSKSNFNFHEVLAYVFKNPKRFEVRNIRVEDKAVGFYFSPYLNSNNDYHNTDTSHIQRIILVTSNQTSEHLAAIDLILNLSNQICFTELETCSSLVTAKLESITELFNKDKRWRHYQAPDYKLTVDDLHSLSTLFYAIDILALEPQLFSLLQTLVLEPSAKLSHKSTSYIDKLLATLANSYSTVSKVREDAESVSYLFFNHWNSTYLIWFYRSKFESESMLASEIKQDQEDLQTQEIDSTRLSHIPLPNLNPLRGWQVRAVARDLRKDLCLVELEAIQLLIKSLLFLTWKGLHTS